MSQKNYRRQSLLDFRATRRRPYDGAERIFSVDAFSLLAPPAPRRHFIGPFLRAARHRSSGYGRPHECFVSGDSRHGVRRTITGSAAPKPAPPRASRPASRRLRPYRGRPHYSRKKPRTRQAAHSRHSHRLPRLAISGRRSSRADAATAARCSSLPPRFSPASSRVKTPRHYAAVRRYFQPRDSRLHAQGFLPCRKLSALMIRRPLLSLCSQQNCRPRRVTSRPASSRSSVMYHSRHDFSPPVSPRRCMGMRFLRTRARSTRLPSRRYMMTARRHRGRHHGLVGLERRHFIACFASRPRAAMRRPGRDGSSVKRFQYMQAALAFRRDDFRRAASSMRSRP